MKRALLQKLAPVISLIALLLAGCGSPLATAPVIATSVPTSAPPTAAAVPTALPTMTWLGMQYPADRWHAETVEKNFWVYGLLTHLALPNCQIMVLPEEPLFILNQMPSLASFKSQDWLEPAYEQTKTDRLATNLVTVKDKDDQLQLVYYEVFDQTGFFGHDDYRLGYFLVSQNAHDPLSCAEEFWNVLTTLQIDQWIKLPVGQG
jgi:hypothetical protein